LFSAAGAEVENKPDGTERRREKINKGLANLTLDGEFEQKRRAAHWRTGAFIEYLI
jgi:hypothetical protein